MESVQFPDGYHLRPGSGLDRALLVKFSQRTYRELASGGEFAHLTVTIDQYLSGETPLWWVETAIDAPPESRSLPGVSPRMQPIACLWLGTAIDQLTGDRQAHVFLLYVAPDHRRRGIGTALMHLAETWAHARGDRQISLQVFQWNQPALSFYQTLGYQSQSVLMVKPLPAPQP